MYEDMTTGIFWRLRRTAVDRDSSTDGSYPLSGDQRSSTPIVHVSHLEERGRTKQPRDFWVICGFYTYVPVTLVLEPLTGTDFAR